MHKTYFAITFFCISLGCQYTIVRDTYEERQQAELTAIDSLQVAPDLTIRFIEYEYVPPEPRRDALDRIVHYPKVRFYVTVSNLGNQDFQSSFVLAVKEQHDQSTGESFQGMTIIPREPIRANGGESIESWGSRYPNYGARYTFVIVTNPLVQPNLGKIEYMFVPDVVNRKPVQVTREFRYDNNQHEITIPGIAEEQGPAPY